MDSQGGPPPSEPFSSPPAWEGRRRWRIPEHPLFHFALLLATFVTTTIFGGAVFSTGGGPLRGGRFSDGFSFSIPLLLILGIHELGHYALCRRHGVAATLPYFLPAPIPNLIGTFGALIRIKEPIRDKRALIEIGAAGPLAGFFTAIPFLVYGVTRTQPVAPTVAPGTVVFEYPILVRFVQDLTGAGRYTSAMVREHPTFMAAWFGLLVTALNLLPIGQLDGGHVIRAALGRRQPFASYAVLLFAALSASRGPIWAFFSLFTALFLGVRHPPVENDDEPLSFGHKMLALLCLAVFLLCFTLVPMRVI
ncbi:MAG TPA: site-2 protease family protein [Thermoanaerobaculia bacterium]|nr:site-2 protease family protein [Thermoanaerobaculia bacterium]